jgi:hypothetical protein
MKKKYNSPICEAYTLPSGSLCQTVVVSGDKKVSGESGGWSNKFWGLTEEEEEE